MRASLLLPLLATACLGDGQSPDPVEPPTADPVIDDPAFPFPEPPFDNGFAQALAAFSGCLTFEDFQAANMGSTWRSLSSSGGACSSCHGVGEFGFVAADDQLFFETITTDKFYLLQYFAIDASIPGEPKIIVAEQSLTKVSTRVAPHAEHPSFDVAPGLVALNAWYELAIARQQAGTCGPPTLEN